MNCTFSAKLFTNKKLLNWHIRRVQKTEPNESDRSFSCGHCETQFTRVTSVLRHLRLQHNFLEKYRCQECARIFDTNASLQEHSTENHGTISVQQSETNPGDWGIPALVTTSSAMNSYFNIHRFDFTSQTVDPFAFLIGHIGEIISFINDKLSNVHMTRVGLCMQVKMVKPLTRETAEPFLSTVLLSLAQFVTEDDVYNLTDQIITQLNIFSTGGSGWIVETPLQFDIKTSKTPRLGGSSYIPTPPDLCARIPRHCILNIRNLYDNYCFLYSVAAALFPA